MDGGRDSGVASICTGELAGQYEAMPIVLNDLPVYHKVDASGQETVLFFSTIQGEWVFHQVVPADRADEAPNRPAALAEVLLRRLHKRVHSKFAAKLSVRLRFLSGAKKVAIWQLSWWG